MDYSYQGSDYSAYDSPSYTSDYTPSYDFGYDTSSYDYGAPSSYDYSSWMTPASNQWLAPYVDPAPASPYVPDILSSRGMYSNVADAQGFNANPFAPYDPTVTGLNTPNFIAQPQGVAAPGQQGGQGLLAQLLQPASILGLSGALSGLIGTLAGGGQVQSQAPKPTTAQKAAMEQGNLLATLGAQGQLPAQQQQASLLQAIMSGQGLSPAYSQAVEQAFQPQLGDLYTQAAQQGRRRGFHDAPATSPPGGAILGPGLANLQGQIAQAKLATMMQLPSLFNQPAATQGGFAQQYLQAAQGAPMQQTVTQPLGTQIGQQVGGALSGVGQVFAQKDAQAQQAKQFQSLLDALRGQQQPNMAGVPS